jgi:hypothetical protein
VAAPLPPAPPATSLLHCRKLPAPAAQQAATHRPRSQGGRARQRLPLMCCNRPRPQTGLGHFPYTGSSVARPAVAIKSARPSKIASLRTSIVATYRTSRGCSCNPGTPALIKRRSSLHEPLTPRCEGGCCGFTDVARVWAGGRGWRW